MRTALSGKTLLCPLPGSTSTSPRTRLGGYTKVRGVWGVPELPLPGQEERNELQVTLPWTAGTSGRGDGPWCALWGRARRR